MGNVDIGHNVDVGAEVKQLKVGGEHVDKVDDDGGDEAAIEEDALGHGRELGKFPLVERVGDEAGGADGKHGDERVVFEAAASASVEREGEKELCG